MVAALIVVNGTPGSDTDLPIDTLVQLTNDDDTGVLSWLWAILDQPDGPADTLSSTSIANPTFTPKKEGTYLIELVVNASMATEARNRVVCAVRQLKTRLRVPAANETVEASSTTGWSRHVNAWGQWVDNQTNALVGLMVMQAATAMDYGNVVYVSDTASIKVGLPGEEIVPVCALALADDASLVNQPLFAVLGSVTGDPIVGGELIFVRAAGMLPLLSGSPAVGDFVYVNDTGALDLTQGTFRRVVGRVVALGSSIYTAWFDGSFAIEPPANPLEIETYVAIDADMDGANPIATGCSFGKRFPATPSSFTITILASANFNTGSITTSNPTPYGVAVVGLATGAGNTAFVARVVVS